MIEKTKGKTSKNEMVEMSGAGEENHYTPWSMHFYWNDLAWGARGIYWEDNTQQDKDLLQSSIKISSMSN